MIWCIIHILIELPCIIWICFAEGDGNCGGGRNRNSAFAMHHGNCDKKSMNDCVLGASWRRGRCRGDAEREGRSVDVVWWRQTDAVTSTAPSTKLHVILDHHLSSLLLAHHQLAPQKLPVVLSATHRLASGINFVTHFVSRVLICLFLILLSSTIVSPHQCHHHHCYHPSPHYFSFQPQSFSFLSNFTFRSHLMPFRGYPDCLTVFSLYQFFL